MHTKRADDSEAAARDDRTTDAMGQHAGERNGDGESHDKERENPYDHNENQHNRQGDDEERAEGRPRDGGKPQRGPGRGRSEDNQGDGNQHFRALALNAAGASTADVCEMLGDIAAEGGHERRWGAALFQEAGPPLRADRAPCAQTLPDGSRLVVGGRAPRKCLGIWVSSRWAAQVVDAQLVSDAVLAARVATNAGAHITLASFHLDAGADLQKWEDGLADVGLILARGRGGAPTPYFRTRWVARARAPAEHRHTSRATC